MALLFGAMDNEIAETLIPQSIRERISSAYIPTNPTIPQPVMKVPLTIYRIEDTLMIGEMSHMDEGAPGAASASNGAPAAAGNRGTGAPTEDQQVGQLLVNLRTLQQSVAQNHQQQQNSIASF